jgi:preprotein translocase subunit YajC
MWSSLLFAQQAANGEGEKGGGGNPLGGMLFPMLAVLALFWFFMMRPMNQEKKQRAAMIAALKKNDRIVNQGGIIGVVDSIKDAEDEVVLKGGTRILKSSIVRVLPPGDGAKDQKEAGA